MVHWSAEQIAGWLKRTYANEINQVSHETIYRSLFVQTRGVLKKELQQYLRSQRTIRRSLQSSLKGDGLGGMPNAVSIREGLHRRRIGRFRVIGRVISLKGRMAVASPHWSSAIHAMSC